MRIAAALFAAVLLNGCGVKAVVSEAVDHPTIVSLNPCTDAILAQVAEPDQIVAISRYSHDPHASSMDLEQARKWPATGGTAEEVIALAPDLVVAGGYLPIATRSAFTRQGISVETFGIVNSVDESVAQVRQLAALSGHPERGDRLADEIMTAVEKARPSAGARSVKALMWQEGGLVPGEAALISELMHKTGFSSQSVTRGLGQGAYLPLEEVLADPPEVILSAGGERMLEHPVLRSLVNTKVIRFDPALLYCGGPSIIRTVQQLAQIRQEFRT